MLPHSHYILPSSRLIPSRVSDLDNETTTHVHRRKPTSQNQRPETVCPLLRTGLDRCASFPYRAAFRFDRHPRMVLSSLAAVDNGAYIRVTCTTRARDRGKCDLSARVARGVANSHPVRCAFLAGGDDRDRTVISLLLIMLVGKTSQDRMRSDLLTRTDNEGTGGLEQRAPELTMYCLMSAIANAGSSGTQKPVPPLKVQ